MGRPAFDPLSLDPFRLLLPRPDGLFEDQGGTGSVEAAEAVGFMTDLGSAAEPVVQATPGSRPTYQTSGGLDWLQSDGSNDFLATSGATELVQPFTRVSAWRRLSSSDGVLWGGSAGGSGQLFISGGTLRIFAGTELSVGAAPDADTDFVAVEIYNGASSRIAVDLGAGVTGNAGGVGVFGAQVFGIGGGAGPALRFSGGIVLAGVAAADHIAGLVAYFAGLQGR
jgi:hypothetical protein